jgi:hypothetical protein
LLDHPPYNNNLALSDYCVLTHNYLKNWVKSQHFNNNELLEGYIMEDLNNFVVKAQQKT